MFDRFCQEITKLKNKNLLRQLMSVEGEQGTTLSIHGKTVISLSSNNYLGLANHPALKAISIQAIQTYGVGAGASRLISGRVKRGEEARRIFYIPGAHWGWKNRVGQSFG